MKYFFSILILTSTLLSCTNNNRSSSELIDYIPENTSIVIKANNIEGLKSSLNNNSLINKLDLYSQIKDLKQKLEPLNYLKTDNELLATFNRDDNDSLEFAVITHYKSNIFTLDSVKNKVVETIKDKETTITKTTIENQTIYSTILDSIFIASNTKSLLKKTNNSIDLELKKVYNTSDDNKTVSILINSSKANNFPKIFNNKNLDTLSFSNYTLVDIDISQDQIISNGITKAIDSSKSFINVFKNTIPQENLTSKICPLDTDAFISLTFNNFKTFESNLAKLSENDSINLTTNAFDNVVEIGIISNSQNKAFIARSLDVTNTLETLNPQTLHETFRDIDIYIFEDLNLIEKTFSPIVNDFKPNHFGVIDDFFVFANDLDYLKSIISNYQNNATLSEQSYFKDIMLSLSDESSLFVYSNSTNLNSILDLNFSEEKSLKLNDYKASAIQFIYETDFAHINTVLKTQKASRTSNKVSEDLNISLDNDLLISPQIVTNHTNNQKDIVVQDIKNNLYLISNNGKVFWKKQLDGKIMGKIEQIDIYKNGRLQLVFNTPKRLYILDRNGKDVSNFPLKFNDEITQPVSVFDYDKKKNYRLIITQDKTLLMYNTSGNIVKGFTYTKAKNSITTQPQHFRIGSKDYIVFAQGNTLEILDRVGKNRIKVKDKIDFSNNDIYLYNNKFTTTTKNGELKQVDTNGRLTSTNLNLNEKHSITTTNKTLVALSENKLKIKSNTVELDFGNYTAPKIFYINDKIYVTVTDLQAKKIYLFDSQAKPISNFPVYGNSSIKLSNIDADKTLEVVTKGSENSIIVYKIN